MAELPKKFRTRKSFLRWLRPKLTMTRGYEVSCDCATCQFYNRAFLENIAVINALDGSGIDSLRHIAKEGLICAEHLTILKDKNSQEPRRRKTGSFIEGETANGNMCCSLALDAKQLIDVGLTVDEVFFIVAEERGDTKDAVKNAYYKYRSYLNQVFS